MPKKAAAKTEEQGKEVEATGAEKKITKKGKKKTV